MDSPLQRHRVAESKLQALAAHISAELPEGVAFTLVTYTTGDGGYSGYVSNGDRRDMILSMRECADTLEAKLDSGPFAEIEELHARKNRRQRRAERKRGDNA